MKGSESMGERLRARGACLVVRRRLQPHLDGELDAARAAAVTDHLTRCDRCRRQLESFARIKIALREAAGATMSPKDQVALRRLRRFADGLGDDSAP